jgi:hypothetical protein
MLEATLRWGEEPGPVLKRKLKAGEFKGGDSNWASTEEGLRIYLQRYWSNPYRHSGKRTPPKAQA